MLSFFYWLLFLTQEPNEVGGHDIIVLGFVSIPKDSIYALIHSLHRHSPTICHATPFMLDADCAEEKKQGPWPQNAPRLVDRELSQQTIRHNKADGTLAVCAKHCGTREQEFQIRESGKPSQRRWHLIWSLRDERAFARPKKKKKK